MGLLAGLFVVTAQEDDDAFGGYCRQVSEENGERREHEFQLYFQV